MSPIILLHGATGAAEQLGSLARELRNSFEVHAPDFYGHGGLPITEQPYSIEGFAEQIAAFIHGLKAGTAVNIFGYSMGGYVAMYLARNYRLPISKIITLGTKFHWDESTAAREIKMLQPDLIEQKVPAFARQLSERHHPDQWKKVISGTANMLRSMGEKNPLQPEDYKEIGLPSLIMLGDRDRMVTREETFAVVNQLPNASLAILPGTPHQIEQVDPALICYHVKRFVDGE